MSTSVSEAVITEADANFLIVADVQDFTNANLRLLDLIEESGIKYLTIQHVRDLFKHVLSLTKPIPVA